MTIFVTNNGTEPATGWSVVLDMNQSSLGNYWNSDFSSTTGIVTATPSYSWDPAAVIAPGETSSAMGFCANRFNPSSGSLASVVSVQP
jgi:hypothetical protein